MKEAFKVLLWLGLILGLILAINMLGDSSLNPFEAIFGAIAGGMVAVFSVAIVIGAIAIPFLIFFALVKYLSGNKK